MNTKRNILLLSSQPPQRSANLALDMIAALKQNGHDVDFLTVFESGVKDEGFLSVYDKRGKRLLSLKKLFRRIARVWKKLLPKNDSGIRIVNLREEKPPVNERDVVRKIEKKYDLVITLFWEDMITARTLRVVYDKLRCPILIYAVDMFPMTGGCFYFRQCTRYAEQCGKCPALGSKDENDRTRINYRYKKAVYDSIECAYLGNSWMLGYVARTDLFNHSLLRKALILINERTFAVRDASQARQRFGIGKEKKFVLFAGAQRITEKRKGFDYLVEAMHLFAQGLSEQERSEAVLLLAGMNKEKTDMQRLFDVEVHELGMLGTEDLALAYSAASVFVSPSVDDAGPSMVNQSLMCGTPVVAFATGVALDLVEEGVSGYRARYRDAADFCRGIRSVHALSPHQYADLRRSCRETALRHCSFAAFAANIERIYSEFRPAVAE